METMISKQKGGPAICGHRAASGGAGHSATGEAGCRCRPGEVSSDTRGTGLLDRGGNGSSPYRTRKGGERVGVGVHAAALKGSDRSVLTMVAHVSTLVFSLPFSMRQIVA